MKLVTRLLQRELIVGLGVATVWLIVFMVFRFVDNRLPWVLALGVTYGLAAYAVSPRVVRMGLMILQRKRVPSFPATRDGLPGDPVNLALIGTLRQLRSAFARAWPPNVQQDWCEGDHWPVRGPARRRQQRTC
jgi:LssY C-terminus